MSFLRVKYRILLFLHTFRASEAILSMVTVFFSSSYHGCGTVVLCAIYSLLFCYSKSYSRGEFAFKFDLMINKLIFFFLFFIDSEIFGFQYMSKSKANSEKRCNT